MTNRSGVVVDNVTDFAGSWLVFEESEQCFKKPVECEQPAAPECDIILSEVFNVGGAF